jgi:hypothetical protein
MEAGAFERNILKSEVKLKDSVGIRKNHWRRDFADLIRILHADTSQLNGHFSTTVRHHTKNREAVLEWKLRTGDEVENPDQRLLVRLSFCNDLITKDQSLADWFLVHALAADLEFIPTA